MTISTEPMEGGITRVLLDGRLDIQGAAVIDLRLNVLAGSEKYLLVDMRNVSFVGSMGIRSLVLPAKALARRGGRMALLAPVPMVEEVLTASKIGEIIPIVRDLEAAAAVLR
jgi:anti-sigma B factor antagonist